jgi:hypothetical protein
MENDNINSTESNFFHIFTLCPFLPFIYDFLILNTELPPVEVGEYYAFLRKRRNNITYTSNRKPYLILYVHILSLVEQIFKTFVKKICYKNVYGYLQAYNLFVYLSSITATFCSIMLS